jgi:glycosyltransferase involved in cell wall biosynthesis
MFVSRLTGIPYSFTAHAKDIYHQEVNLDSLRSKIRSARFVVTVSAFNRAYLKSLMSDWPDAPGDVRRLYNGIDLAAFRPDPAVQREAGLILSVGRLVEKKGLDDLVRACGLLRDRGLPFRCEIIGKGPLKDELNHLIADLHLENRVQLVGAMPQDEVVQAYRRAAIFALPCIIAQDGNRDGLPTVLLEAMATGLPVVSTDVTGVPEIVDAEVNGLIVPQSDPTALADALARLLQNPELREQLALAARRKVEQAFDVRANVAVLHRWFAEPVAPRVAEATALPALTEIEEAVPVP